jgi:hypothetical protein
MTETCNSRRCVNLEGCATLSPEELRRYAKLAAWSLRNGGEEVLRANLDGLSADEISAVRLLAEEMLEGASRGPASPSARLSQERPRSVRPSIEDLRAERRFLVAENLKLKRQAAERDRRERSERAHRFLMGR